MKSAEIAAKLKALAQSNNRTKTARLREILPDVEAALAAGVRRKDVIETLKEYGLDFNLRTFNATFTRLRRHSRHKAAPPSSVAVLPDETTLEAGSTDPGTIDNIISSTPDLAALAKMGKQKGRSK